MENIDGYKDQNGHIGRENLKKIIPYEDPFLMIDSVSKLTKDEIVAEKIVKPEEEYLQGHFKGFPIMPGALIVEGLGQAATLLIRYNLENHEKYDVLAYKIRSAKFFRPTFPGQTIRFEAKKVFKFKIAWFVNGNIYRGEKLVSKAKMVLAVVEKDKFRSRYQKKSESLAKEERSAGELEMSESNQKDGESTVLEQNAEKETTTKIQ